MKKRIRPLLFLAVFLAIAIVYDALLPGTEEFSSWTLWILYITFPIVAALIALYTSRIYGFKSANGRALLFITGGLVCWAVAEIVTFVAGVFFDVSNFDFSPLADTFLMLGYPIIGVGIYQGFRAAGVNLKTVKKSLLAIVISVSLILTALVLYFGVYQAYDPSVDTLTNIASISYGLADLVLVIGSLLTILVANEYKGGKLASFWKIMVAGFFAFLVADILFAMYGELESQGLKPYAYIDILWMAAYTILTYGMLDNYLHVRAIQKTIKLKLQQRK